MISSIGFYIMSDFLWKLGDIIVEVLCYLVIIIQCNKL